jgi:hypothetical protein
VRSVNGRAARAVRRIGDFKTSDPGVAEIRRLLFGDRFQAGFGRRDPAYMPLYPHEAAQYLFSRGAQMWDKHHSAEELEQFIDQAPPFEQLGHNDQGERWYDDSARLVAKWILSRLRAVPEEARLVVTFWESMESAYPHIADLQLSTAQQNWARAAALRIFDAYRYDGAS